MASRRQEPPKLVGPMVKECEGLDMWDITPYIERKASIQAILWPGSGLNTYPDKMVGLPLGLYPSFLFYGMHSMLPVPTRQPISAMPAGPSTSCAGMQCC